MQGWFAFYGMLGGAAATLMGLLFVAVSINAKGILNEEHGHQRRLAEQAFQNYISVLLVSLFALFPSLSPSQFGQVTLMVTAASSIWVLVRLYLTLTKPNDRATRIGLVRRQVILLLGFGMMIFAAARMALHRGDELNLMASAVVVLLLAATRAAWLLLLTISGAKPAAPSS